MIIKKLNKVEKSENESGCEQRIHALWAKKNLIGLGNASLLDARVIGFAETHTDMVYKAHTAHLINALYREGDIILVEGQEEGTVPKIYPKDIKPGCLIYGWEPKGFEMMKGEFSKNWSNREAELVELMKGLVHYIGMQGPFKPEIIEAEKEKLNQFIQKINELNKYYKSKSRLILNVKKNLEKAFEKFINGTLDKTSGNHDLVFCNLLSRTVMSFEKVFRQAIYRNVTRSQAKDVLASIQARNDSLVKEIKKHRSKTCKVFVIGGTYHFLQGPIIKGCEEVKKTLQEDQFIVLTRKSQFKGKFAQLNRDFKSVPSF